MQAELATLELLHEPLTRLIHHSQVGGLTVLVPEVRGPLVTSSDKR